MIARRQSLICANGLVLLASVAYLDCGGTTNVAIVDIEDDAGDSATGSDATSSNDTGASDAGADGTIGDSSSNDGATDGGKDASGDTGAADTGSDTGITDTGVGDTGITDTGITDTGPDVTACPSPTAGIVYVGPTGSDTTGNGSASCPFVTITKALSTTAAASGATTILVTSGSPSAPFVYGAGCTAGAASCDPTPIQISSAMNKGLVIQGTSSDPTALKVVGGTGAQDVAVFEVSAPDVGFQNLTVSPRRVAAFNGARVPGAIGISFAAAASSGTEASVTNVVIDGIVKSASTESTSSGIAMRGGTSPTVGPGVTIVGGDHSVLVTQSVSGAPSVASKPIITSSVAAPSFFHGSQFACVRIDSTNASATAMPSATLTSTSSADPGRLHLQDCGGNGGIAVDTVKAGTPVAVTNTLIDTTGPTAAAFYGVRLQSSAVVALGAGVTVTGINEISPGVGAAIEAGGTSKLGLSGKVLVNANVGNGVHITDNAGADIVALTATANRNGIVCDPGASVFLRDSTTLANRVNGTFIRGGTTAACAADLGSNGSAGNNVFNRTADKNGKVGLCYTAVTAGGATASASTWSCGVSALAGCSAATAVVPTPTVVSNCDQVGDYNNQPGSGGVTVALPQTCCGQ
ncbi:MAG: hypothetical protein JWM74_3716 [Myxococcaceae bacterium]|nr:hypothetical protein [Myxococcaceae bacterium]